MSADLAFDIASFALGFASGLWLGFKLWRQSFVKLN